MKPIDIEAIKAKVNKIVELHSDASTKMICEVQMPNGHLAHQHRGQLLDICEELIDAFRWRKVAEEKPEIRKPVNVKSLTGKYTVMEWTFYPLYGGNRWTDGKGFYAEPEAFPEWRPIE